MQYRPTIVSILGRFFAYCTAHKWWAAAHSIVSRRLRVNLWLGVVFAVLLALPTANAAVSVSNFPTGGTWNAPSGVTWAYVEAWGGGGAGGGSTSNNQGGGGGAGGQYARRNITNVAAGAYTVTVATATAGTTGNGASGGSSTFNGSTVVAVGGAGGIAGQNGNTGATGSTAGGAGSTVFAGGSGGTGCATGGCGGLGGGGGGGAGSTGGGGNGAPGTGTGAGGSGTTQLGGNGGAGAANANGNPGLVYGGGGGGGERTGAGSNGGAGAAGFVRITYNVNAVPTFSANPQDYSTAALPTNQGSSVTFTAQATDTDGDQWRIIVCRAQGITGGNCTVPANHLCSGALANSGSNSTCLHSTAGESAELYSWWAYACDTYNMCSAANNVTAPYAVNHAPTATPTLSSTWPLANAANVTCIPGLADSDVGDTTSATYRWFHQNEGSGGYSLLSGQTFNHVNSSFFDSNDNLICEVRPTDNHGFAGARVNTTAAIVRQGILSATSNLQATSIPAYGNTTLFGNCTVANGDSVGVTLVVQDNRTGSFTQSTTTPGNFYVNQSSQSIGALDQATSATYSFTVFGNAKGDYSMRVQCQATDTNATTANSSPTTLTVNPYAITPTGPVNGSVVDRDATNASMSDFLLLAVSVDTGVPDGTVINYFGSVVNPFIATAQDIALGLAVTSSGAATFFFDPVSSLYAGVYDWYGSNAAGEANGTRTFTVYGQLDATYNDANNFPASTYYQNETLVVRTNYTTLGPESALNVSSLYGATVNAVITAPNGSSVTLPMSFTNPYWNLSYNFLSIGGVGTWTVNTSGSANVLFADTTANRTMTVTGYMNITENLTSPAAIDAFEYATTSCRVRDQHTSGVVSGATVSFYRNGTLLGVNTTDALGYATLTEQVNDSGVWIMNCSVSNQPGIFYDAGDAPIGSNSLTVNSYAITATNPANGTAVDRDETNGSVADATTLTVSVPLSVPDGTTISFYANLTDPTGLGQTNIPLGSNTTSGNVATLHWNPNATTYAGDWTWWGDSSGGNPVNSRTLLVYGTLSVVHAQSGAFPSPSYASNDSVEQRFNVTSPGPESRAQLAANFAASVSARITNTSGSQKNAGASFTNPYWNATQALLPLLGVGTYTSSASTIASYFYGDTTSTTFSVTGFVNVTQVYTTPASVSTTENTTTSCFVQDQFSNYAVAGANATFARNGTILGWNLTDASGLATLTFLTGTIGEYVIYCNVTAPAGLNYTPGDTPSLNTSLTVTAGANLPPVLQGNINDSSNATNPTNEGLNVTFSVVADDPEVSDYYLLICRTAGLAGASCAGTTVCQSANVSSGSLASCQRNTSSETPEVQNWFGYVCDVTEKCSSVNNATAPYNVNHAPVGNPYILPTLPTVSDALTCFANATDADSDGLSNAYRWFNQNESTGSWNIISGQTTSTIVTSFYDSNDKVLCEVTTQDEHGFSSGANNATAVTVQNGTLNAYASLASSSLGIYANTTLSVTCEVTGGDAEIVYVEVEDNRTGSFTLASESPAAVFVNDSNRTLGRVSNANVTTQVLVQALQTGNYSLRARCVAGDADNDPALSAPTSILFSPFAITPTAPANDSIIDRDETSGSLADEQTLTISVPPSVPDGTTISFYADLSDPVITGETGILLGSNTTAGGVSTLTFNPAASRWAGTYNWYGTATNGSANGTRTVRVHGSLQVVFASATSNPNANTTQNGTVQFEANVTSLGVESRTNLSALYGISVNSSMTNASLTTSTVPMSYTDPYWNATQNALNLYGRGGWTVNASGGGAYFIRSVVGRSMTVYGYTNITSTSVNPSLANIDYPVLASCTARDQHGGYPVQGVTISFYRNATFLGANLTGTNGVATYTFNTSTVGSYTVNCSVSDELGVYSYAGDEPMRSTSLTIVSVPASFVGSVSDGGSDAANPTNEGSFVTFSANATTSGAVDWYLLVCRDALGQVSGVCNGTQVCRSANTAAETIATCQNNTAGESAQSVAWYAYACDITNDCGLMNNDTSPYHVNHAPVSTPYLTPASVDVLDTITCVANATDADSDSITPTYRWFRQNEGSGGFTVVSGQTTNQLTSSSFDSNDDILCEVTPVDEHGFAGSAVNTSAVTIAQGTLSASATIASGSIERLQSTTLDVFCSVAVGDAQSVTIYIEDNRTGSFSTSSTAPASVYVNVSSIALGSVASGSSATHSVLITGNTIGSYAFRARCNASDATPVTAVSSSQALLVIADVTPPVISSIVATPSQTSFTVTWTTDDPSDSLLSYGNSTALGLSEFDATLLTSHSLTATGLLPSTTYYYNITSCNSDAYCATSGPFSITTSTDEAANPFEDGYCTGVFIERPPGAPADKIVKGDIFEFYCETPHALNRRDTFTITLLSADKKVRQTFTVPTVINQPQTPIYPNR